MTIEQLELKELLERMEHYDRINKEIPTSWMIKYQQLSMKLMKEGYIQ